ncbi:MAG: MBL fold metallo-hydrolase [Candidatus Berkelbacteria bacterium]|nr:MBL fold metallo-hydrolase [Candidatus Berkelbacteria bacterium]
MLLRKLAENWRIYLIIFLALLALAIWSVYFKEPDNNLHIFVLDVGQGDAELIQKGNYQILIDGGPDDSVISQLGKVMPVEDREIEEMILTHPHADHVTGLVDILSRYKIDKIVYSGVDYSSNVYQNFQSAIKEKNIPVSEPKKGETEKVFDQGTITYLWPSNNANVYKENLNNTSEVFRFDYGNFTGLFTGDCEVVCWQQIINQNRNLISNIIFLKVSHHGSNTGSDENNIPIIWPKIAAISCGVGNKYGFPHKETLDQLQKTGSDIYRTDLLGTIDISTDGKNWSVNN